MIKWTNKLIVSIVSVVVLFFVALNCFTIVSVGEEASVSSFGKVHEGKVIEGFNIVAPWWDIDQFNMQHETYTYNDLGVASQDKFKTSMDVAYTGAFSKNYADVTRKTTGTGGRYLSVHVEKRVLSCLTKAGGEVENSQAFFDKYVQEQLAKSTLDCVNDYLITVGGYSLSSVQFSDIRLDPKVKSFMVKTKERQEEENQADSALNIAETNAQKVVKQSAANLLAAENNKQAAAKKAEAGKYASEQKALGNKALANSITPELIDYIKANNWDGKLPTHNLGTGTTMLLK